MFLSGGQPGAHQRIVSHSNQISWQQASGGLPTGFVAVNTLRAPIFASFILNVAATSLIRSLPTDFMQADLGMADARHVKGGEGLLRPTL